MSSSAQIRTAILTVLQGVSGIGLVYERQRYSKSSKTLMEFYVQGGVLQGGFISRKGFKKVSPEGHTFTVLTTWEIDLFRAFQESGDSELAFDAVIDSIDEAFIADQTLGGVVAATVTEEQAGIRLLTSQPAMFAGVLVHYAKLSLITEHDE